MLYRYLNLLVFAYSVSALYAPRIESCPRQRVILQANPISEIVDALDKMLGVAELSETDLKDSRSASSETFLKERQEARARKAPAQDALNAPSVAIFFGLVGLLPLLAFFLSVQSGLVHPFGL